MGSSRTAHRSTNSRGDDIPIIKGSALAALEDKDKALGHDAILELMAKVDEYIPQPERPIDQAVLDAGRRRVLDLRAAVRSSPVVSSAGIVKGRRGNRNRRSSRYPEDHRHRASKCSASSWIRARAGDNIGALLRGTKREEVERGQVLAKPGSVKPHTKFKAEAYILTKEEGGRPHPRSFTKLSSAVLLPPPPT